MNHLEFFDAECQIGLPMNGALECAPTAKELLLEMDRVGVRRALVSAINVAPAGSVCGNRQLAELLEADAERRLVGSWSVLPECCAELPTGDAWFAAMRRARIATVELQPASHRWLPRRAVVGALFDRFAERRVPIKISIGEAGGWAGVYDLVERFPRNRFLLTHCGLWGCDRNFRPLLETSANVYLETSEYWVAGGITALVQKYGSGQLLFGSGYPQWNHGQQMLNIRHAEISDADRAAIAGGNLTRLLNEVQL